MRKGVAASDVKGQDKKEEAQELILDRYMAKLVPVVEWKGNNDFARKESRNIAKVVIMSAIREILSLAPSVVAGGKTETAIDLDRNSWEAIKRAAMDSPWMPKEYMMQDWVSDVCEWLSSPLWDIPSVPGASPALDAAGVSLKELAERTARSLGFEYAKYHAAYERVTVPAVTTILAALIEAQNQTLPRAPQTSEEQEWTVVRRGYDWQIEECGKGIGVFLGAKITAKLICDAHNASLSYLRGHTNFQRVQELAGRLVQLQSAITGCEPGEPGWVATQKVLLEKVREFQSCSAQLATARALLEDVTSAHRDPDSAEYNECDISPCCFCESVSALAPKTEIFPPEQVKPQQQKET